MISVVFIDGIIYNYTKLLIFYLPKTMLLWHISYEVFEKICFMQLSMFVFFCFTNIETFLCDKRFWVWNFVLMAAACISELYFENTRDSCSKPREEWEDLLGYIVLHERLEGGDTPHCSKDVSCLQHHCFSLTIKVLHSCFCIFSEGISHQQSKSINVIYFVLSLLRVLDLKFMPHSRSTDHFNLYLTVCGYLNSSVQFMKKLVLFE